MKFTIQIIMMSILLFNNNTEVGIKFKETQIIEIDEQPVEYAEIEDLPSAGKSDYIDHYFTTLGIGLLILDKSRKEKKIM